MKQKIFTPKAPMPAGPYSQGIKVGNRIYVAGQGPLNVETGTKPEGIAAQTRQVLINIQNILEAGGAKMSDVVKVTVHLADLRDFEEFNSVYKEFFEDPYPVRTTVESGLNNILVEIDVIAEIE
ncbi:RidA family protein [Alicyclobacillus macrosporangiidus]|uniref:RidA family protein n=1 Tax=Alicyclobacillus macrosporangiidus TaxID=392015 RepID=UPI000495C4D5|nr:Rid family detoxifying hydrolase [Alicyclobacillus macrosporangiidus]